MSLQCECGKDFKRKSNFKRHQKSCKSRFIILNLQSDKGINMASLLSQPSSSVRVVGKSLQTTSSQARRVLTGTRVRKVGTTILSTLKKPKTLKDDNFANEKARSLALSHNILASALTGKGKDGKITSKDIRAILEPVKKKKKTEVLPQYKNGIPKLVTDLSELSLTVRQKFPFGGKESHFQAAMEAELQELGYFVQHEVAELYHYTKLNGESIRMPHDIRSREDLLLPREKMVLELKAIPALKDKDHCQLLRYMEERRKGSWGVQTIGMLINYGDTDMEIWYVYYKDSRFQRVRILQKSIEPFTSFVDSFVYSKV
jgi:GxxExxY protein